jgi:zinc transport system ATP-binding protein
LSSRAAVNTTKDIQPVSIQQPHATGPAEQPAIDVRDVSFSYGDTPVLEGARFAVAPREMVCMVGPNGGGKTTLIRLILGLLQPSAGWVRVFGALPRQARRRVGYMPQYARHDLDFPVTVRDLVLMGRLGGGGLRGWLGWPDRADRQAARLALEQVEMQWAARRPYAELSGGQRQRVLIARALACQPDLLVLDEPTSNVDTRGENQLLDILHHLSRQMAIVTVTHDLGFVSNLVDRVICVNRHVDIHPTGAISDQMMHQLYGERVRAVEHHESQISTSAEETAGG